MYWVSLFVWLVVCFAVAGLGARWTSAEIPTWYRTLRRPAIAPPDWIFGPVWSLLYLLMALAAWRVSLSAASPLRSGALALFVVQLALNLAWSWIFFRKHAIRAAAIEIGILWIAIGATTLVFERVTSLAAWLMIPYLAWVSFAAVLNWAFRRLN
jgi:translocator protein